MKFPKNHGKKWTTKEMDYLIKHAKAGMSFHYIAKGLERTEKSVEMMVARKLPITNDLLFNAGKKWTSFDNERLLTSYKHKSIYALSIEFGRTTGAIKKRLKRLLLKSNIQTDCIGADNSIVDKSIVWQVPVRFCLLPKHGFKFHKFNSQESLENYLNDHPEVLDDFIVAKIIETEKVEVIRVKK